MVAILQFVSQEKTRYNKYVNTMIEEFMVIQQDWRLKCNHCGQLFEDKQITRKPLIDNTFDEHNGKEHREIKHNMKICFDSVHE